MKARLDSTGIPSRMALPETMRDELLFDARRPAIIHGEHTSCSSQARVHLWVPPLIRDSTTIS